MENIVFEIEDVLDKYPSKPEALITIMQDLQARLRYLPEEGLVLIAERLNIPLSKVYSVATFYNAFSFIPKGKYIIKVCLGSACHLKGSEELGLAIERELGISGGETTPDQKFSYEPVNCLGACALAPVVVINEKYYGKMTLPKLTFILENCE